MLETAVLARARDVSDTLINVDVVDVCSVHSMSYQTHHFLLDHEFH